MRRILALLNQMNEITWKNTILIYMTKITRKLAGLEAYLKSIGATDSSTWKPEPKPPPNIRTLSEEEAAEWIAAGKPMFWKRGEEAANAPQAERGAASSPA